MLFVGYFLLLGEKKMDKHKDNEIRLVKIGSVQWLQEVINVSGNNPELFNTALYEKISRMDCNLDPSVGYFDFILFKLLFGGGNGAMLMIT